ncbi:MAG: UDP-N-acetylmuramate dehydrogenase [Marinagarivorans sp.]|nr:UDP-N-acetylmuramate dehydrogenase [Marinagarivorans sp.]
MSLSAPVHWQKNIALDALNTMACPSRAEYFLCATSEAELVDAISSAQYLNMPWHILGGGSNVLCPPLIQGLVIQPLLLGKKSHIVGDEVLLTIGAGEPWHELVIWCLEQGFYGLENLALIPGNAGAAPIQNIGAYGVEVAKCLQSVRFYHAEEKIYKTLAASECELAYRDSIFKHALKGQVIISQITLKLSRRAQVNIRYAPLQQFFNTLNPASITPQAVFDGVCAIRRARLPDPIELPNSGSFFKNPILPLAQFIQLQQQFPQIPSYSHGDQHIKIPAAWLIDQAGLKGQWIGQLRVHSEQALVLTNPNKQTLTEVLLASEKIIAAVVKKFGVLLEPEPQVLGGE